MAGIPANSRITDEAYDLGEKNIIAANILAIIFLFFELFI
jgi:hypothetical protein